MKINELVGSLFRLPFFMRNIFFMIPLLGLLGCGSQQPLPTVDEVDLESYSGMWYDIAHLPQRFQKGCACVTAEYTPLEDGNIKVVNTCFDEEKKKSRSVEGKAFPVSKGDNSKLKVQFFWPFRGNYWILDIRGDYEYAMVGGPDRQSLWILSRTRQPDPGILETLLRKARELGFDTSRMEYTRQVDCE